MYLKQLDVIGFKSFADKTKLTFDPGLIAIVGPNANDAEMMWGNYNAIPNNSITLLDALKTVVPAENLKYVKGCGIMDFQYSPKPGPFARFLEMTDKEKEEAAKRFAISINDIMSYAKRDEDRRSTFAPELNIPAVLKELEGYETIIFAGGISPRLEGEEMSVQLPGFSGGDKTDIELPAVQARFLKAMRETGKPVVYVNCSGSCIAFGEVETYYDLAALWISRVVNTWSKHAAITTHCRNLRIETAIVSKAEYVITCSVETE